MYTAKKIFFALIFLCSLPSLFAQTGGWFLVSPPGADTYQDMHWLDADNGFVIGALAANGLCFSTTDGGDNWTTMNLPSRMKRVFFLDAQNGFVSSETGKFSRTTDGGNSWSSPVTVYNSTTAFTAELQFTDPNTGYATWLDGMTGYGYKTVDGGLTWNLIDIPIPGNYIKAASGVETRKTFWFLDNLHGFAGYRPGWLHVTYDGAASWDSIPVDSGFVPAVIDFVDDSTGYAAGEGATWVTTDGGLSWAPRPGQWRFGSGNDFVSPDTEYHTSGRQVTISTWETTMYKSADNGATFNLSSAPGYGPYYSVDATDDLDFLTPEIGYAIAINPDFNSNSGAVWKTTTGTTVNVDQPRNADGSFEAYPNPAQHVLEVRLGEGHLTLAVVMDLQGRELLRRTAPGTGQELRLDVAGLPAGMYLVAVETVTGERLTRKFFKE